MKKYTLLLGLALAAISCGQSNETGYTISGTVRNCGDWGKCGHVVLVSHDGGKQKVDTAQVVNGRFTLTGRIEHPYFASMYPAQSDTEKPIGRVIFFLENEKYSIKIKDGIFSSKELEGGTTEKLLSEVSQHQKKLDSDYNIESIEMQLHATLTPPDRIEKLKKLKQEYDSATKAFRDSITIAHTPSYFSLLISATDITAGKDPDSIRQSLEIYLQDDRFKDDPWLKEIIDLAEGKRRP